MINKNICLNFFLFTLLPIANHSKAQVCFSPAANFAAGGTGSVVSADFNNDGKADMAVAGTSNVSVLLGTGTGNFGPYTNFTVGTNPIGLTYGDYNNDGKIDLATANYTSNDISILLGTGTGSFGPASNFTVGTNNPNSIVSADFNGDGKLDLAIDNYWSNSVSVFLGTGLGTFGLGTNFSAGVKPTLVYSADFNGDGKPDLVTANYNSTAINVLLGTGTGSFVAPVSYFPVANNAKGFASADFNGDGKTDIAVANDGTSNVSVVLGTGSGSFGAASNFAIAGPPTSICSADFNNDGNPDLATADNGVSILLGNGTGGFGNAIVFSPGNSPTSICKSDFNNDSKSDLGVANLTVNNLSVLLNAPLIINITGASTACAGSSLILNASGLSTYTWSANAGSATTNTVMISPASTTSYTVSGTNAGCSASKSFTINVNPLPIVTASTTSTLVCAGTNVTLTGGGASTYTWSNGVINGVSFIATSTQNYNVVGTDLNGCNNSANLTINVQVPPIIDICMVTTDSLSMNNIIYWDKTPYPSASSYYIYRDTANNNYALIGIVSKDSLSKFVDTSRHIGSVNGDPNIGPYRYKIAISDTCGNLGVLSAYHTTFFITHLGGGTFSYNQYGIEFQSTPIPGLSQYVLKRDNFNTNNYVTAATIGATSTTITDPQYSTYQTTANWFVETSWTIVCTPTFRLSGNNNTQTAVVKSRSNIRNNHTTGVKKTNNGQLNIYPNPNNGVLNIQTEKQIENASIEIYNVLGEKMLSSQISLLNTHYSFDISNLANGIYQVRVLSNNAVINQNKLVKQ